MTRLLITLFAFFVFGAHAQVLEREADSTHSDQILFFSWSTGYHYQGFHGTEAELHLTTYTYGNAALGEIGIFLGGEFNFGREFNVFAPDFGVEYIVLPSIDSWWGLSGRIHGTIYRQNAVSYLVVAPELGINFGTLVDFYYSYNYAAKPFDGWTPHRIGIRLTLGYPRTAVNLIGLAGGL